MKFIAILESIFLTVSCFFGSIFNLPNKNVKTIIENNGSFICGINHPNEQYDMLKDAGFGWVRFDVPFPYNSNGEISQSYINFKQRCKNYTDRGFKILAVTPYPKSYVNFGFNPAEDIDRTKEIALFLYNDLKDITGGFQITNEMGLATFMYPLTLEEAVTFIGVQLEVIDSAKKASGDNDFIIGYNQANVSVSKELNKMLKPYIEYCDYVGIDLYIGVQSNDEVSDYSSRINKLYRQVCKPIIVTEFGFWSEGGSKTEEEKLEILQYYGYSSEEEAVSDGQNFIAKLPTQFQNTLFYEFPGQEDQWPELVFSKFYGHFYGETSDKTLENVGFTPEGQAQFFKLVIPELQKLNCVAGMFIYCCQDTSICWACGHSWCPFETRWGIFNSDGTPKPSYYAVKQVLTGE